LRTSGEKRGTTLRKSPLSNFVFSSIAPILHGLEEKGLLTSAKERVGSTERLYRATAVGHKALYAAKAKVRELFGELFADEKAAEGG
jgi:DNA-binding PadR family transcriptional regulator